MYAAPLLVIVLKLLKNFFLNSFFLARFECHGRGCYCAPLYGSNTPVLTAYRQNITDNLLQIAIDSWERTFTPAVTSATLRTATLLTPDGIHVQHCFCHQSVLPASGCLFNPTNVMCKSIYLYKLPKTESNLYSL